MTQAPCPSSSSSHCPPRSHKPEPKAAQRAQTSGGAGSACHVDYDDGEDVEEEDGDDGEEKEDDIDGEGEEEDVSDYLLEVSRPACSRDLFVRRQD